MVFCLVVCFGVNLFVTIFSVQFLFREVLLPHCRFKGYNAIKYLIPGVAGVGVCVVSVEGRGSGGCAPTWKFFRFPPQSNGVFVRFRVKKDNKTKQKNCCRMRDWRHFYGSRVFGRRIDEAQCKMQDSYLSEWMKSDLKSTWGVWSGCVPRDFGKTLLRYFSQSTENFNVVRQASTLTP